MKKFTAALCTVLLLIGAVLVPGALRLAAGQDLFLPVAAGVVLVLLNLLQGADEIAV